MSGAKKRIGFYHSGDLDGHCSGAILRLRFGDEIELIGINYGQPFPRDRIDGETEVWMVDFSLQPWADMMRLCKSCEKLVWIDHHASAIADWNAQPGHEWFDGLLRVGYAACELTWEYLFGTPLPPAVWLLGRYDVWDHAFPTVLPFQHGCRAHDTDPANSETAEWWRRLLEDGGTPGSPGLEVDTLIKEGHAVLAYAEAEAKKTVASYAFETEFEGLRLIACNTTALGSKLYDSRFDPSRHDACCTFVIKPAGHWSVHLYSTREDLDLGALAKRRGGGGHRGAAGFQCRELPFRTPLDAEAAR